MRTVSILWRRRASARMLRVGSNTILAASVPPLTRPPPQGSFALRFSSREAVAARKRGIEAKGIDRKRCCSHAQVSLPMFPAIEFVETHDVITKPTISRRNGQVPRENCEISLDERAAEARAQSGAAWRVSLKGASQCLSWGHVEFAPLLFPMRSEQVLIESSNRQMLNEHQSWEGSSDLVGVT